MATGTETVVAGTGGCGSGGDGGPATTTVLSSPFGVALDGVGNLFIADIDNGLIRRVDAATGVITTVAGGGIGGDGGPATAAALGGPVGVALDGVGDLFIADAGNGRIRRVAAPSVCVPTLNCDDQNPCTTDTCDPVAGCQHAAAPNGTTCNDGNACTRTDTCQAGACVGGSPVACAPADQCHVAGICDPATGVCSQPAKPDGSRCDDGDACTTGDTCQARRGRGWRVSHPQLPPSSSRAPRQRSSWTLSGRQRRPPRRRW
jgi:hypothetical protein